jgi:hypothetical protein
MTAAKLRPEIPTCKDQKAIAAASRGPPPPYVGRGFAHQLPMAAGRCRGGEAGAAARVFLMEESYVLIKLFYSMIRKACRTPLT